MSYNWNQQQQQQPYPPPQQSQEDGSAAIKQENATSASAPAIEKYNQVKLPSLANLNNVDSGVASTADGRRSSDMAQGQVQVQVQPLAASPSTSAALPHTAHSTHEQMSTASLMNPASSASYHPSASASATPAAESQPKPAVRTERQHSGFSVASFDNPLPPTEVKKPHAASTTTTTAASSVSPASSKVASASSNTIPTASTLVNQAQPAQPAANGSVPQQQTPKVDAPVAIAPAPAPVASAPAPASAAAAAPASASSSAAAAAASQYRPLNVKDALSYLEQVKFQFNARPDVYNQFLDIMKDFKSQAIDTPGVIERVSTLFKGFPALIQGFNTFLPQGYRIDCTNNPEDPIRVTTPMGTTTLQDVSTATANSNNMEMNQELHQQQAVALSAEELQQQQMQQQQQQQGPPPITQYSQANQMYQQQQNVISSTPQVMEPPQGNKPADVEFSQAISYVNKIKNRFADQPDIYKNFLEILQTYQRDQKPINEVYAQVTVLFQNAPDLLDDFKKFLPDSSASEQQQQQQQPAMQMQPQNVGYMYGGVNGYYQQAPGPHMPGSQQNLPPIGSFSPPNNGGQYPEEYNDQQRPQMMGLPSMMQHEQTLEMNQAHPGQNGMPMPITNEGVPISNMRGEPVAEQYPQNEMAPLQERQQIQPGVGQPIHDGAYMEAPVRPEIDLDPSIVPVVPEPTEPIENNLTLVEETSFFDKVKKAVGTKQVYTEFLKILNLYSQDLLEVNELVEKVEYYLGPHKDLFDWFKNFVGYKDLPKTIENIVHEKHRLDLDLCEACGPSYKKLPKSDTFMPCSGRDDMCWEVLNDEWVGHPVWASEDSGFIAHRKNQYEETLFKTEEERHEYDFYIESNLRTIQTLETIANKISNMTEEEKQVFKLPPGLGHTSLTIYKKVIRKVYDKERGFEVIDALHEHPAIAVPVILKRLKQKDEEWRRAQREWNKIWRELEQKVYFKSLDHLGLTFKQADKKLLTTKQLISEISSIKVDQTNKRMHWLTPKPKSQLDFDVKDVEIIFDILKLGFVFIDNVSNYSNPDKERLKDMMRVLISLFFSIPLDDIDSALKKRGLKLDDASSEGNTADENAEDENSRKRARPADLVFTLSDILRREKYQRLKHPNNDGNSQEQDEAMAADDARLEEEAELIRQDVKKPWLLGDIVDKANANGVISNRTSFNLFGNTYIYIFIRHLVTLYDRLLEVKNMNDAVTKEINGRKTVQFAKDLCLISTQLKDMGLDFVGKDSYQEILNLGERLILGDIEHQWFEESLRQAFNNKAFKLYTIDKVTQAIVKHAHTLMTDNKTADILKLFERDRTAATTSSKDQILYRLQTRSHMSNTENMFRIQYDIPQKHICIQYIALDDLTLKDSKTEDAKWKYYITSYSLPHPTEGIDQEKLTVPFLERILEFERNEFGGEEVDTDTSSGNSNINRYAPDGVSNSTLKINITPVTYSLDIEEGSMDIFSRKSLNNYPEKNATEKVSDSVKMTNKFLDKKLQVAKHEPEATQPANNEEMNHSKANEGEPVQSATQPTDVNNAASENPIAAPLLSTGAAGSTNEKENLGNEQRSEISTSKSETVTSTGSSNAPPPA
ncbi:transcriptional regulator [Maudiozyma humilis]|uniref:Transcriptional regulator n=1 Tax=Maudiozyma humilis TaxID=51915 RepID=A0AAV5RSN2_MAUHU|nr:transcriptional regulator [Kazachstania humilis]